MAICIQNKSGNKILKQITGTHMRLTDFIYHLHVGSPFSYYELTNPPSFLPFCVESHYHHYIPIYYHTSHTLCVFLYTSRCPQLYLDTQTPGAPTSFQLVTYRLCASLVECPRLKSRGKRKLILDLTVAL